MSRKGRSSRIRVHLDVRVSTGLVGDERLAALEAGCARLVALGAAHAQTLYADEENELFIPMLDIESNEFCIG
ncbi:VOC family protein [Streptomyces sp. NBC_01476]|uniref:VOC family protein n=1 Tax=Streptomyces sp. NBC_01476 TaxID=2903881 RepID=UPI002E35BBB3|nr:VOC family protein [Streptomyces sp. NBC_01476]